MTKRTEPGGDRVDKWPCQCQQWTEFHLAQPCSHSAPMASSCLTRYTQHCEHRVWEVLHAAIYFLHKLYLNPLFYCQSTFEIKDVNNQVHIQILIFSREVMATAQDSMEETGWRCPLLSAGTGRLAVEGNRAVQDRVLVCRSRLGSPVLHTEPMGSQGTSDTIAESELRGSGCHRRDLNTSSVTPSTPGSCLHATEQES